ncbi:hypothetical protein C8R43DRAFT_958947 [Mycena crocata]|nr:hypothetical protein C8R43DRAFT_958947 [Mycena crocata]
MQGSIDGTYVTRAQHWRKHRPLHCRGQLRAIVLVTSHTPVNRRVRVTRLWPERTGPVPVKRPVDPSAMATGESPTTNMSKVLQWPGPKHVNNVTAKTSMMSRAGSISRKSYETKETNKEYEVKAVLCLKVIQTWQHTSMNEQNLPPDWPRENRVLVPMQMAELMGDMAEIGSRASQAGPGIHVKMTNPDKGINQAAGFSLTLIDLLD